MDRCKRLRAALSRIADALAYTYVLPGEGPASPQTAAKDQRLIPLVPAEDVRAATFYLYKLSATASENELQHFFDAHVCSRLMKVIDDAIASSLDGADNKIG